MPNERDIQILRELAKEYMQIASLPVQGETAERYRAVNRLAPERPVVLLNELPWHELNFDGSLTLLCEDEFCQGYERFFRQTLFKWKYVRADMYVEPFVSCPKVVHFSGIGVECKENTLSQDDGNNIVAHEYEDLFEPEESLDRLKFDKVTYDEEATMRNYNTACEIFDGIVPVKITGKYAYITTWDFISTLRGVTPLLIDLAERPEFMHALVSKLTDIAFDRERQVEALNLYDSAISLVHCTAGITDVLPQDGFDPNHVRMKDTWGRGAAQIFAHVSKDMHDEFDIQYIKKILDNYGAVYYGCCEPLHNKIDIVEKIKNLRKISITPWADVDVAAECIGSKYVLASKPNPAYVADTFDAEVVKGELTHVLEACKRNNTACEFVLKDISTVGGKPQNLFDWEKCAMETVLSFE